MEGLHIPVKRLPTGKFEKGHKNCHVCGSKVRLDDDEARASAGIVRCENGHMWVSGTVNVGILEI
tara:strand:- start:13143 stop:13337 length:195 start_codon:yes stop_codon:yes gene_type:complete